MSKSHNANFWKYLQQAAPHGRTMLLPVLLRAQENFGSIPA